MADMQARRTLNLGNTPSQQHRVLAHVRPTKTETELGAPRSVNGPSRSAVRGSICPGLLKGAKIRIGQVAAFGSLDVKNRGLINGNPVGVLADQQLIIATIDGAVDKATLEP